MIQEGKATLPESDEILIMEKMSECSFLKNVFHEGDPLIISKENDWLFANLVKDMKTYVFGYKGGQMRDWGAHLPRWSLAVGSMELGLVIAHFSGVVKDGKYVLNHVSTISRKCRNTDIHASVSFAGTIEQISIDENCDNFLDKIYNVDVGVGSDFEKEPWAGAAKIILESIGRLKSGNW
ncbi:MAG: hypothetical protein AB1756_08510 [Acidobacteriota bacterium]